MTLHGTKLKRCFTPNGRCLEFNLRCFSSKPKEWVTWLPWAEYWFNTNWLSATKMTTYQIISSKSPPTMLFYIPKTAKFPITEAKLT